MPVRVDAVVPRALVTTGRVRDAVRCSSCGRTASAETDLAGQVQVRCDRGHVETVRRRPPAGEEQRVNCVSSQYAREKARGPDYVRGTRTRLTDAAIEANIVALVAEDRARTYRALHPDPT